MLGKSHGQKSLEAVEHRVAKSQKWLSMHACKLSKSIYVKHIGFTKFMEELKY